MMKPNSLLLAILATCCAAGATSGAHGQPRPQAPVFAPAPGSFRGGVVASHRSARYLDRLEWKVDDAVRYGKLPASDGRQLVSDLRQMRPIAFRAGMGNANAAERDRLDRTVNRVELALSGRRARSWDH